MEGTDAAARELIQRFLTAFERLDLDTFIDCFAPTATAFFPEPEPSHRHDGRAAIRDRFASVFAAIRAEAVSGPPFHRLDPEDMLVQPLSPDTAVVTFLLRNQHRTARRTLMLSRVDGRLLIAHLHASNRF